uniref:B1620_C3_237 n=1 Tax=Mycobacterium leprae TaxID=1769 RepID=Q49728_MYCLR|nr:B1620_C3_237 [Mycobacterium leprae]
MDNTTAFRRVDGGPRCALIVLHAGTNFPYFVLSGVNPGLLSVPARSYYPRGEHRLVHEYRHPATVLTSVNGKPVDLWVLRPSRAMHELDCYNFYTSDHPNSSDYTTVHY